MSDHLPTGKPMPTLPLNNVPLKQLPKKPQPWPSMSSIPTPAWDKEWLNYYAPERVRVEKLKKMTEDEQYAIVSVEEYDDDETADARARELRRAKILQSE